MLDVQHFSPYKAGLTGCGCVGTHLTLQASKVAVWLHIITGGWDVFTSFPVAWEPFSKDVHGQFVCVQPYTDQELLLNIAVVNYDVMPLVLEIISKKKKKENLKNPRPNFQGDDYMNYIQYTNSPEITQ